MKKQSIEKLEEIISSLRQLLEEEKKDLSCLAKNCKAFCKNIDKSTSLCDELDKLND